MNFFSTRPNRTSLRRSGIVKERLFNCDLGEHLLNSNEEVPAILKCCAEVLEVHGIVDGIYRLSGAASTINKLRHEFDDGRLPELTSDVYIQDIHSVSSLLKMYFRELPNPLLTYELYDKFIEAITGKDEEVRLSKICDVIRQLPPPHYRTAEYLFRHLNKMASHDHVTSMHCKNLAIVWAPNLLRSKELEQMNCGTAALRGVGIQAIVTEYLIKNVGVIFNEESQSCEDGISTADSTTKPKSFSPMPTTQKLLSLEEAQERKSQLVSTHLKQKNLIEVGAGTAGLPIKYHTVINPKSHQSKDKKKLREKLPSPSRFRTLFRRSQSTSFKENQAIEVGSKPGSAREKKTSSVGSEAPPDNVKCKTDSTNNKRNLSTSALLSNGTPAGDASFGILDDFKRLSTSCEIPAEIKEKQGKSGAKKLKNKHRSTSVDVASSELNTLLSVHVSDEAAETSNKSKVQPSKEKSSKKKTSAHRQSPVPSSSASAFHEGFSDSKGKKNRKSKSQKLSEMADANDVQKNIAKGSTTSESFVAIYSKVCPNPDDEDRLLDKPVLASDESDFKSDSLEGFEVMYADGLRGSPLEANPDAERSDSGKLSIKNQLLSDEDGKDARSAATLAGIIRAKDAGEEEDKMRKDNQEVIARLNSSSGNDLLAWSLSSDVTGKDLYKELSPTFNDIWMGGGCYGNQADRNAALGLESTSKPSGESVADEKEEPATITSSSARVHREETICSSTPGTRSTESTTPSTETADASDAAKSSTGRVERPNVTEEDFEWKMNNFEVALNILEQSCDLQPEAVEGGVSTQQQIGANDDDDPVFLLSEGESSISDYKAILESRMSFCGSPEDLPKSRSTAKSTSSIPPPSTESLSDAALDLFSFNRMYSSESLSHAKLQVNNEDGYVYASYKDLYGKPSNINANPHSSSKDHKLTSAPVTAPNDEREILRKLASYGVGGAGERTVMMPVGNAAKKSDSNQQVRNTVPSSCLSARVDEAFLCQSKDVCTPSSSSHSFPTSSQASTDPLRRKENILSSPASNSCKESGRDKMEFLLRPSSNSAFRNHHHRHSSRHFKTPSPEIFHSSITPPLPVQTGDPFGAHASSVRLTSREIKMWQDRAAQQPTVVDPPKVEQKFSKSNDIRSFQHQPPVIIFNRPSNIFQSEMTCPIGAQKSQARQTTHFGTKQAPENASGQPRSPTRTPTKFSWTQRLPSTASNVEAGRKSLPASSSHFRKSISMDENGDEKLSTHPSAFNRDIGPQYPRSTNSPGVSFSRSETHRAEYSAKEERFSAIFHERDASLATAKCLNSSSQKSSQTTDQSISATPPTPRANQTFVLAKKQLFENNGNC